MVVGWAGDGAAVCVGAGAIGRMVTGAGSEVDVDVGLGAGEFPLLELSLHELPVREPTMPGLQLLDPTDQPRRRFAISDT